MFRQRIAGCCENHTKQYAHCVAQCWAGGTYSYHIDLKGRTLESYTKHAASIAYSWSPTRLHSRCVQCSENILITFVALTGLSVQWRGAVITVRYELNIHLRCKLGEFHDSLPTSWHFASTWIITTELHLFLDHKPKLRSVRVARAELQIFAYNQLGQIFRTALETCVVLSCVSHVTDCLTLYRQKESESTFLSHAAHVQKSTDFWKVPGIC